MKKLMTIRANITTQLPCNRLFSLGTNFPKWQTLGFSRNFSDLKIHDPNNQKIHVSDILCKVYI